MEHEPDRGSRHQGQAGRSANCSRVRVETAFTPTTAPNCNALSERFFCSIKEECLGRAIAVGTVPLQRALRQMEVLYILERSHQDIGNRVIERPGRTALNALRVVIAHERLGGR